MDDRAKIAALAAEMTRLNKMPNWCRPVLGFPAGRFYALYDTPMVVNNQQAVLSALSGVAAESIENDHLCIVRAEAFEKPVWELWRFEYNGSEFIKQYQTRHEALIAALKQVEVKK